MRLSSLIAVVFRGVMAAGPRTVRRKLGRRFIIIVSNGASMRRLAVVAIVVTLHIVDTIGKNNIVTVVTYAIVITTEVANSHVPLNP